MRNFNQKNLLKHNTLCLNRMSFVVKIVTTMDMSIPK